MNTHTVTSLATLTLRKSAVAAGLAKPVSITRLEGERFVDVRFDVDGSYSFIRMSQAEARSYGF